ncbi:MAG: response regulator [Lachnospiraceae bacterium]|nr:response regulator [Lachnospiraceae bacterium]
MKKNDSKRPKMIIAEHSDINRMILNNIFEDNFTILTAKEGQAALDLIEQNHEDLAVILLDCAIPVVDCFEILSQIQKKWSKDHIPVIMISPENDLKTVTRTYKAGAFDYITRPFNSVIVTQSVDNILSLHQREAEYTKIMANQMLESYRNSHMIIEILSGVIEFRSGENALHIVHVEALTEMFLRELMRISDRYFLSDSDILMLPMAAALHDIGKITISSEILNKPGKLTDEEFELIKKHTTSGSEILNSIEEYREDPLIKFASYICRWHHERYDGHGYPDGLVGDEIPIAAQLVSIADVYDSLTSDRSYRKALSNEEAVQMILDGKSGVFNPLLLECLRNLADKIPEKLSNTTQSLYEDDIYRIIGNSLQTH